MSKTIWVVERTDNHGEFQPFCIQWFHDRSAADARMQEAVACEIEIKSNRRFRVKQYMRREVRS